LVGTLLGKQHKKQGCGAVALEPELGILSGDRAGAQIIIQELELSLKIRTGAGAMAI